MSIENELKNLLRKISTPEELRVALEEVERKCYYVITVPDEDSTEVLVSEKAYLKLSTASTAIYQAMEALV